MSGAKAGKESSQRPKVCGRGACAGQAERHDRPPKIINVLKKTAAPVQAPAGPSFITASKAPVATSSVQVPKIPT